MAPPKRRVIVSSRGESVRRDGAAASDGVRPSRPAAVVESSTRDSHQHLELLAWGVIAAIALGVRWINLDGNPLQPAEAALAMASWRIVQHQGIDLTFTPLLVYLNAFLFLVMGASDAVARAGPALAGSAVALSPLFLRRDLGRVGALVAALILATSPTMIFASRSVDPTMLTIGLGIGTILLLRRALQSFRTLDQGVVAVLLALLVLSGPLVYDVVATLAVVVGIGVRDLFSRRASATGSRERSRTGLDAKVDGAMPGALMPGAVPGRFALILIGTIAVVGTGLGTHLDGFGESLAQPLASWVASISTISWRSAGNLPVLLLAYEPLSLVFGVVGAIQAFRRGWRTGTFLGWCAGAGSLILALGGRGDPLWIALIVVPLALLAGVAIADVATSFRDREQLTRLGIFAAVLLPLLATSLIAFGHVTLPDPIVPPSVAVAPPLAILAFIACYAYAFDWSATWRALAAVGAVGLLLFDLHAAMLLNRGWELNPAELVTGRVTSTDVRRLAADVAIIQNELEIAHQIEGRNVVASIDVVSPFANPLTWYLRDRRDVRLVNEETGTPGLAILGVQDKPPRGQYAAELYQVSVSAPAPSTSPGDLWRWWMYRESNDRTAVYLKVYVKTQLGRP